MKAVHHNSVTPGVCYFNNLFQMNPKLFKYILVVGVISVWGIIFYRLLNAASDTEISIPTKNKDQKLIPFVVDSFSLYADYPDPFLEQESTKEDSLVNKEAKSQEPAIQTIIQNPVKPDISYLEYRGLIINPQNKTKVAIVRIKDKELMIKEKDRVEGVYFKKISKEKLIISIKGNTMYLYKIF